MKAKLTVKERSALVRARAKKLVTAKAAIRSETREVYDRASTVTNRVAYKSVSLARVSPSLGGEA